MCSRTKNERLKGHLINLFCLFCGVHCKRDFQVSFYNRISNPPLFSLFLAPPTGPSHIVVVDYSQIEVRIMAHFAQDTAMLGFLSAGGDVFRRIASKVCKKPADDVTPAERKAAKAMCYGILYGKGATSLSEDLACSKEEASRFLHDFKHSYEGIAAYIQSVVGFCRQHGYVETLMGRKRFLPTIFSKNERERAFAERQAVNTVCQGSAADIVKLAMLRLQHALPPSCSLVLQVHDELVFDVPSHVLHPAIAMIRQIMENVVTLSVPLPVKLQAGMSWGELEDM